jgi:hypothetical protein
MSCIPLHVMTGTKTQPVDGKFQGICAGTPDLAPMTCMAALKSRADYRVVPDGRHQRRPPRHRHWKPSTDNGPAPQSINFRRMRGKTENRSRHATPGWPKCAPRHHGAAVAKPLGGAR